MNYYLARIQYDGTGYYGFQWQTGLPTIQHDFNLALGKILSGKISTMGASRTDTGVHAFEQFVKITSENEMEVSSMVRRLNEVLPPQIHCLDFSVSEKSFLPAKASLSKEYRYLFTNIIGDNRTQRKFIANNPYPLNLEAMKICVNALVGKHDFHNFVSTGSNVKSTVREISVCELSAVVYESVFSDSPLFPKPDDLGICYQLRVEGNGFLKQMIRHLMTALWKVGNGRLSVEEFLLLLDGPKKSKSLWKVAHPKGLFLYKITYPSISG